MAGSSSIRLRQGNPTGDDGTVKPRPRPLLHFTAQRGYSNDPHGLVHHDGRYHMFFQHNPDALVHTPHVSWGHAVSPDLILWREMPAALVPTGEEVGCWSGSTVLTDEGPVIAYTRIASDDWDQGQVALARPLPDSMDLSRWMRVPGGPVVPGPPPAPTIVAFRDPQIRADGTAWKAVVGGGLPGRGGCVAQYSISPDLDDWKFDGILAARSASDLEPFGTGTVWECPQFLQVDGRWVLIVSVWEEGEGLCVAYALGDYDGHHFVAERWGRFAQDDLQYATTTFTDADGRPCAMSWLRESPALPRDDASPWRSAMTLPVELRVRDDALVVAFHRNLEDGFVERTLATPADGRREAALPGGGRPWRLRVAGTSALAVTVADEEGTVWRLEIDEAGPSVQLTGSLDGDVLRWPLASAAIYELDIVADGDIVEVACPQAGGVAALRTRVVQDNAVVQVDTDQGDSVSLGWWREP